MKIRNTSVKVCAVLLAVWFAFSAVSAAADVGSGSMDVDLLMAQNAVAGFGIHGQDGKLLVPRRAPEMKGRGEADEEGVMPDYRGVVGYMSIQAGWEVSEFNTFVETPWQLPVYEKKGDGWQEADTIKHKTSVLVVDQELTETEDHRWQGYLYIVRLDIHREVWVDVSQFVTVPYWTLDLPDAINYGYCIASYRGVSRHEPVDRKGNRGPLPDGIRVLICNREVSPYTSEDMIGNPILGVIFRNKREDDSYTRTFLFFNPEDLTIVY